MRITARRLLATASLIMVGCRPGIEPDDPGRMASLKVTYDGLHRRFEKAAAAEPLVAAAFADRGQVVIAIRSGLVEEFARSVATRYLDRVTLDLNGVKAHSSGELHRQTFLGDLKVGGWDLNIALGDLVGHLRAGSPQLTMRGPNLIDLKQPVSVQETSGNATLQFAWDSAGVVGLLCRDFTLTRQIRGRVLTQTHTVSGTIRLDNLGGSLTATPVFPNRRVPLLLELNDESWAVVKAALRSQDTFSKCGTLLDPEQVLGFLRDMAKKGVDINLPGSIFRPVTLPGHLQESVIINHRPVAIKLKAESLRADRSMLWASASVQVSLSPKKP